MIGGGLDRIPAVQTAVHRGKRKMRRSASNRKTALRADSGQRKAQQGQYRVGQNSLLLKKNNTNLDLRSDLGANERRVWAESGLGGRSVWFGSKLRWSMLSVHAR